MKKIDEILTWKGFGNGFGKWDSKCRVRVYEYDDFQIAVLTELPDNEGTSVTNCIEHVAAMVLANYKLAEVASGIAKVIFVQHLIQVFYTNEGQKLFRGDKPGRVLEEFHQVGFGVQMVPNKLDPKRADCRLVNPTWKALKKSHVESLIGEELGL